MPQRSMTVPNRYQQNNAYAKRPRNPTQKITPSPLNTTLH